MSRISITTIFTSLSLLGVSVAQADIVFVNLNEATQEQLALTRLVNETGEKLYILPRQDFVHKAKAGEDPNTPEYQTPDLAKDIAKLARQGVRPRTMIFSGHHSENEQFYGSAGQSDVHAINKYLKKVIKPSEAPAIEEFFASIKSLYLWGCYTGTIANTAKLMTGKDSPFTDVDVVFGFLKKGPLGTNAQSGRLLESALRIENQISEASPQGKSALLENVLRTSDHELVVHQKNSFFSRNSSSTRELFLQRCLTPSSAQAITSSASKVFAYYNNELPLPKSPFISPLRDAYEKMQEYRYCIEMKAVNADDVVLSIDRAIRLIYNKNVLHNFAFLYAKEMRAVSEAFKEAGIPNSEFFTKLESFERGEGIRQLEKLKQDVVAKFEPTKDEKKLTQSIFLTNIIHELRIIYYPKESYIPYSWIEEASTYRSSSFEVITDLETAKEDALQDARLLIKYPKDKSNN